MLVLSYLNYNIQPIYNLSNPILLFQHDIHQNLEHLLHKWSYNINHKLVIPFSFWYGNSLHISINLYLFKGLGMWIKEYIQTFIWEIFQSTLSIFYTIIFFLAISSNQGLVDLSYIFIYLGVYLPNMYLWL